MTFVTLHIAIDGNGRGAIALTRDDAVRAVGATPRIAVTSFACWSLSAAMIRGGTLPIQFSVEKHGKRQALQERAAW